jgi:hypothetical protein
VELSWVCCFSPVIPALRRLRQEEHEFKASLGHIQRPYLKNNLPPQKKTNKIPHISSLSSSRQRSLTVLPLPLLNLIEISNNN